MSSAVTPNNQPIFALGAENFSKKLSYIPIIGAIALVVFAAGRSQNDRIDWAMFSIRVIASLTLVGGIFLALYEHIASQKITTMRNECLRIRQQKRKADEDLQESERRLKRLSQESSSHVQLKSQIAQNHNVATSVSSQAVEEESCEDFKTTETIRGIIKNEQDQEVFTKEALACWIEADEYRSEKELKINVYKLKIRKLNRYGDIVPYVSNAIKLSRQVLQSMDSELVMHDYINASDIEGGSIIAAQGPLKGDDTLLPGTIEAMRQLIVDKNAVLLSLVNFGGSHVEYLPNPDLLNFYSLYGGKDMGNDKCFIGEMRQPFGLGLERFKIGEYSSIRIKGINWPDKERISSEDMMALYATIKSLKNHGLIKDENTLIVHCSAGVGRTGTAIAAIFKIVPKMLDGSHRPKTTKEAAEFALKIVKELREKRARMVQAGLQFGSLIDFQGWIMEDLAEGSQKMNKIFADIEGKIKDFLKEDSTNSPQEPSQTPSIVSRSAASDQMTWLQLLTSDQRTLQQLVDSRQVTMAELDALDPITLGQLLTSGRMNFQQLAALGPIAVQRLLTSGQMTLQQLVVREWDLGIRFYKGRLGYLTENRVMINKSHSTADGVKFHAYDPQPKDLSTLSQDLIEYYTIKADTVVEA